MKHKIRIWTVPRHGTHWWYAECLGCGDDWVEPLPHPGGVTPYYGRLAWADAYRVGVYHQTHHVHARDRRDGGCPACDTYRFRSRYIPRQFTSAQKGM